MTWKIKQAVTFLITLASLYTCACAKEFPSRESVYETIISMKAEYPHGMRWTNDDFYVWKGGIYGGGYGCAAFAFMLSDAAFGDLPARQSEEIVYEDLRVGDILRIQDNSHSVVILEVHPDHVVLTEGNYNETIHWGRTLTKAEVLEANNVITRYLDVTFSDVSDSDYYSDAVYWAVENGITKGTTETTFSPDVSCTRGQVVTFLWRAQGCPEPKTRTNPFHDVNRRSAFYKAILWASENDIARGYSDGSFRPNQVCTKSHIITFIMRSQVQPAMALFSLLEPGTSDSSYDTDSLAEVFGLTTDESYNPDEECSRADAVTYLYRVMV